MAGIALKYLPFQQEGSQTPEFPGRHSAGIYLSPVPFSYPWYFSLHFLFPQTEHIPECSRCLPHTDKSFIHQAACTQRTQQHKKYGSTAADDPHCFFSHNACL